MPPKKAVQNNFPTNGYRRPLNPEFLKELVAAVRVGRSLSNIVNARRLQQLCNQSSEAIFALLDALLHPFRQAFFHAAVVSISEALFNDQLRLNESVFNISQHVQALLSPHGIAIGAPHCRCNISHKRIAILFPGCHVF